jgi:hypothetical protein
LFRCGIIPAIISLQLPKLLITGGWNPSWDKMRKVVVDKPPKGTKQERSKEARCVAALVNNAVAELNRTVPS